MRTTVTEFRCDWCAVRVFVDGGEVGCEPPRWWIRCEGREYCCKACQSNATTPTPATSAADKLAKIEVMLDKLCASSGDYEQNFRRGLEWLAAQIRTTLDD